MFQKFFDLTYSYINSFISTTHPQVSGANNSIAPSLDTHFINTVEIQ